MPRLATSVYTLGVSFALVRGLLSTFLTLRAMGVAKLTGAEGQPVPVGTDGSPLSVGAAVVGASWGMALAAVLLLALHGARRGNGHAWAGLLVWWGLACAELVSRVAVAAVPAARNHALAAFFTGSSAVDDVCCCMPMTVAWLSVLGAALLWAAAQGARRHGRVPAEAESA